MNFLVERTLIVQLTVTVDDGVGHREDLSAKCQ